MSLTFVVDEISSMRKLGSQIDIYAVRKPASSELPAIYQDYADETHYVLPVNKLKHVIKHLSCFVKKPFRYLACLMFILSRKKCSIKERLLLLAYFAEAVELVDQVTPDRYKHLHVHFLFGGALIAIFLKKLTGISFSVTGHGTDFLVEDWLLREKIEAAEFVRIGTQYSKSFLLNYTKKTDDNKFVVLPFGINTKHTHVEADDVNKIVKQRDNKPIKILNVGRLEWQKNQALLIDSAIALHKQGVDFELQIIGAGALEKELKAQVDNSNISDKIILSGALQHDQVFTAMQQADIFVFPSVSEGFGIVLLEAMSCGLAVIASDINGTKEIIQHEKNGLVFANKNGDELTTCLAQIISDTEKRHQLQNEAIRHVRANFEQEKQIEKLFKVFNSI